MEFGKGEEEDWMVILGWIFHGVRYGFTQKFDFGGKREQMLRSIYLSPLRDNSRGGHDIVNCYVGSWQCEVWSDM